MSKFYVRSGNSSRELPIDEIPKYVGKEVQAQLMSFKARSSPDFVSLPLN